MTSRPSGNVELHAIVAAIGRSPIVARPSARFTSAREWASIRRSPDVDAFVLAWIASHVRDYRSAPRRLV